MAYQPGKGTVLQVSIASTFTTLANMVELSAPSITNPEVDVTVLTDNWRQFLYTIPDGGTIEFTGNWDPSQQTHSRLVTAITSGVTESFKLIASTTTNTITFTGLVTSLQPGSFVVDDVAKITGTIKITSGVVVSS